MLLLGGPSFAEGQKEGEVGKPATLTFCHLANQTHLLYMNPLKEAFHKAYPNVTIKSVEVTTGGYEALSQKVLLGAAAGDPPDVGQVGFANLRTMVDSGCAVPLDELMASDPSFKVDNLAPAMMALGVANNKQFLIPIGPSTPMMLSNTDLFAAVGLDPKAPPRSWEETRKVAAVMKTAGKMGILWGWSITGNWIFQALLENCGGSYTNAAGTQSAFNGEAGLKALTYLADLSSQGLMPVTDQTIATFITGNLGMLVESSAQRVNTPTQCNFPVKFSPIPTPDGSSPKVPAGGSGVMIFAKNAAQQEAAWEFIRWITEEEASWIIADNTGYTPPNQAVIRELQRRYASDENNSIILDQVGRFVPWYSWPGKNSNKISKVLRDMQEAALLGRKAPQQALDDAAREVDELLK